MSFPAPVQVVTRAVLSGQQAHGISGGRRGPGKLRGNGQLPGPVGQNRFLDLARDITEGEKVVAIWGGVKGTGVPCDLLRR